MSSLTVRDFIDSMVVWTQSGYLDAGAWEHIRSKIDGAALPTNIETLRLNTPSGGQHPLQSAIMVDISLQNT